MMNILIQVAAAVLLIALMMGVRLASGRALFRFRMNNGFRAHECDGTCGHHGHGKEHRANQSK
jgi:hypothetical protein